MRCLLALLLGLLDATMTWACDGPWEYLGQTPWGALCAIENPNDSTELWVGTYRPWDQPEGGGVYVHTRGDTGLVYRSMRGWRVFSLSVWPTRPTSILAVTNHGLFRSAALPGDTTWTRITYAGVPEFEPWAVAISPVDTSLWVLSSTFVGSGVLYLSRNSGQTWQRLYHGTVYPTTTRWSRQNANWLYFTEGHLFERLTLSDSTIQTLSPGGYEHIWDVVYHPSEPWLYLVRDHGVERYDERTGDTLWQDAPQGVAWLAHGRYVPGEGLLVESADGFYRVSDDLLAWTRLSSESQSTVGWDIDAATARACVAGHWQSEYAYDIYRVDRTTGGATLPPLTLATPVTVYPNPTRGELVIAGLTGERPVVRLYNLLGQEVLSVRPTHAEAGLRLALPAALPSGLYFLQMETERAQALQKVFLYR